MVVKLRLCISFDVSHDLKFLIEKQPSRLGL